MNFWNGLRLDSCASFFTGVFCGFLAEKALDFPETVARSFLELVEVGPEAFSRVVLDVVRLTQLLENAELTCEVLLDDSDELRCRDSLDVQALNRGFDVSGGAHLSCAAENFVSGGLLGLREGENLVSVRISNCRNE